MNEIFIQIRLKFGICLPFDIQASWISMEYGIWNGIGVGMSIGG